MKIISIWTITIASLYSEQCSTWVASSLEKQAHSNNLHVIYIELKETAETGLNTQR